MAYDVVQEMNRISPAELEDMRSRGFDRGLIEEASDAVERGRVADVLIDKIFDAFRGVTLDDGVGLQQAQGLDDYEDEAICAAYRESDEKEDWQAISSDELFRCNSSLSFFDAEGMRFHLPAYLISALRGDDDWVTFHLTSLDAHGRSYFSALSPIQRQVVREFLLFVREDEDHQFDRSKIDGALATFWSARYQSNKEAQQVGDGDAEEAV